MIIRGGERRGRETKNREKKRKEKNEKEREEGHIPVSAKAIATSNASNKLNFPCQPRNYKRRASNLQTKILDNLKEWMEEPTNAA